MAADGAHLGGDVVRSSQKGDRKQRERKPAGASITWFIPCGFWKPPVAGKLAHQVLCVPVLSARMVRLVVQPGRLQVLQKLKMRCSNCSNVLQWPPPLGAMD